MLSFTGGEASKVAEKEAAELAAQITFKVILLNSALLTHCVSMKSRPHWQNVTDGYNVEKKKGKLDFSNFEAKIKKKALQK